jgi:GT2 family glycosyltransferase
MGEYIAFLDVDDLWPKENLRMLVKELVQHSDIDVVHGYAQLAYYNPVTETYEYRGNPAESFPYYIGAALYRREVFVHVGLFDRTLPFAEDTDWFVRAEEKKAGIKRLEEVTLVVRRHGNNMTYGGTQAELRQFRILKKSLDRMRARG